MNIIAIDIGSTSMKFAVVSLNTHKLIDVEVVDTPPRLDCFDPKMFEVNIDQLYELIDDYITRITKKHTIKSLYLSTQMHGYVYESRHTKHYVSWQDTRCLNIYNNETVLNSLKQTTQENLIKSLGIPLKSSMGTINLYAQSLLDQQFDDRGELFSLGSYIIHKLCGNNICHITNAAPMGLIDVNTKQLNKAWIEHLGLHNIKVPTITDQYDTVCGHFSVNGQMIDVYPDFGDQQISILGTQAKDKEVIFNMATAAQICCIDDHYEDRDYEIRPYFDDKYLLTVTNMPSGRNLDVFYSFIQDTVKTVSDLQISHEEIAKRMSGQFNHNTTVHSTSAFFDEGGGAFSNLSRDNFTINNMLTALYYDYIRTYKNVLDTSFKSYTFKNANFLGGLAQHNENLVTLIAEELKLLPKKSDIKYNAFNGIFKIALVNEGFKNSLEETEDLHLHEGDL